MIALATDTSSQWMGCSANLQLSKEQFKLRHVYMTSM